jgi:hypothetical protein
MNLVFQKRVAISLAFALLCTSATPTKADGNNAGYTAGMACIIAAGVVGLCGLIYGLVQTCKKKSNEQIVDDAQKAFDTAHMYGRCFYTEYVNTFEQACYGEPLLDHIERNFLEPVACKAHEPHIHIHITEHIRSVQSSLSSLKESLKEVKGAIKSLLRSCNRVPLYNRLVKIEHDIEAELAYLTAYHQRFSEHQAYFILAKFVFELFEKYQRERAVPTQYIIEEWAQQYVYIAKTSNGNSDYPIVHYHAVLCNHITILDCYIRDLGYQYTRDVPHAAKVLREYLMEICDFIVNTSAFKEELERKKEDDVHRELLALRRREVEAQEAKARAEKQRALAAQQQARAAQQQAAAARQQQTVVVVQQQVVQQAPATQQQSTQQSTATNQTNGTNSNAQTITVGQGNNQRQVSVAWYEQNKPGAVDSGVQ